MPSLLCLGIAVGIVVGIIVGIVVANERVDTICFNIIPPGKSLALKALVTLLV